jgi:flagellar hook-basal body complex protein FliE
MTDPVGAAGNGAPIGYTTPLSDAAVSQGSSASFKQILEQEIATVNELQQDAMRATEGLAGGGCSDVETVLRATEQADAAFQMLMQVRNHVVGAYHQFNSRKGGA